jgi:hypothetical protein
VSTQLPDSRVTALQRFRSVLRARTARRFHDFDPSTASGPNPRRRPLQLSLDNPECNFAGCGPCPPRILRRRRTRVQRRGVTV